VNSAKNIVVNAPTAEDRDDWLKDMQACIDERKQTQEVRQKAAAPNGAVVSRVLWTKLRDTSSAVNADDSAASSHVQESVVLPADAIGVLSCPVCDRVFDNVDISSAVRCWTCEKIICSVCSRVRVIRNSDYAREQKREDDQSENGDEERDANALTPQAEKFAHKVCDTCAKEIQGRISASDPAVNVMVIKPPEHKVRARQVSIVTRNSRLAQKAMDSHKYHVPVASLEVLQPDSTTGPGGAVAPDGHSVITASGHHLPQGAVALLPVGPGAGPAGLNKELKKAMLSRQVKTMTRQSSAEITAMMQHQQQQQQGGDGTASSTASNPLAALAALAASASSGSGTLRANRPKPGTPNSNAGASSPGFHKAKTGTTVRRIAWLRLMLCLQAPISPI